MTQEDLAGYFSDWKTAYQLAFGAARKLPAFADLAKFCHADETTVVRGDRDQSLVLEGRRQTYLRIQNFLDRTPEELVAMFTKPLTGDKADD